MGNSLVHTLAFVLLWFNRRPSRPLSFVASTLENKNSKSIDKSQPVDKYCTSVFRPNFFLSYFLFSKKYWNVVRIVVILENLALKECNKILRKVEILTVVYFLLVSKMFEYFKVFISRKWWRLEYTLIIVFYYIVNLSSVSICLTFKPNFLKMDCPTP